MSQTTAQLISNLVQALAFESTSSAPDNGVYLSAANTLSLSTNSIDRITAGTSELVINESGASVDFRVEGDTNANLLFVDASTDRIGVGTNSVDRLLHVEHATDNIVARFESGDANANIEFADNSTTTPPTVGANGDNLRLNTNGTAGIHIDTSQRVGINTTSPGDYNASADNLVISDSGNTGISIVSGTSNTGNLFFADGTAGNASFRGYVQYNHTDNDLIFGSNAQERARIDSSGRFLVGPTSSSLSTRLQVMGNSASSSGTGSIYVMRGNDAIGSGVNLGEIVFTNFNGQTGAWIQTTSDAAWTLGSSHPTRINFATTAASATSPTERLHIAATGAFGLSGANYGSSGDVLTSQGSGSAPQWATPSSASWTMANVGAGPGGGVVAFTSIPSDVDIFIMSWNELDSANDASYQINLGTSSGYATSGYFSSSGYIPSPVVSRSTSAFHFEGSGGSGNFYGQMIFTRHGSSTSNTWHGTGMAHFHNSNILYFTSGYVALGNTLDRARLMVTSGGLATQGSVTLQYLRT